MSNPSKQKGTAFEVSLLPALHQLDGRVERSALKGTRDAGDFTRLYYLNDGGDWNTMVVSAKNCRQVNLSGWLKEAERQRQNAKADSAIVVHKKRGTTDPTAQYVTMTLGTLVKLLS